MMMVMCLVGLTAAAPSPTLPPSPASLPSPAFRAVDAVPVSSYEAVNAYPSIALEAGNADPSIALEAGKADPSIIFEYRDSEAGHAHKQSGQPGTQVEGVYEHSSPEGGDHFVVQYTAGLDGYQAQADHLPVHVKNTPEVVAARQTFVDAFNTVLERSEMIPSQYSMPTKNSAMDSLESFENLRNVVENYNQQEVENSDQQVVETYNQQEVENSNQKVEIYSMEAPIPVRAISARRLKFVEEMQEELMNNMMKYKQESEEGVMPSGNIKTEEELMNALIKYDQQKVMEEKLRISMMKYKQENVEGVMSVEAYTPDAEMEEDLMNSMMKYKQEIVEGVMPMETYTTELDMEEDLMNSMMKYKQEMGEEDMDYMMQYRKGEITDDMMPEKTDEEMEIELLNSMMKYKKEMRENGMPMAAIPLKDDEGEMEAEVMNSMMNYKQEMVEDAMPMVDMIMVATPMKIMPMVSMAMSNDGKTEEEFINSMINYKKEMEDGVMMTIPMEAMSMETMPRTAEEIETDNTQALMMSPPLSAFPIMGKDKKTEMEMEAELMNSMMMYKQKMEDNAMSSMAMPLVPMAMLLVPKPMAAMPLLNMKEQTEIEREAELMNSMMKYKQKMEDNAMSSMALPLVPMAMPLMPKPMAAMPLLNIKEQTEEEREAELMNSMMKYKQKIVEDSISNMAILTSGMPSKNEKAEMEMEADIMNSMLMNKQKMEEDGMPSMALKAEEETEEEVMNTMFKYKNDESENNSRRRRSPVVIPSIYPSLPSFRASTYPLPSLGYPPNLYTQPRLEVSHPTYTIGVPAAQVPVVQTRSSVTVDDDESAALLI